MIQRTFRNAMLRFRPCSLIIQLFVFQLTIAGVAAASEAVVFTECEGDYPTPGDAECTFLPVSENPANSGSRTIRLHIMRVPAVNASAKDPLFVIVGGPGGAAARTAPQYLPYFRAVQQSRDVVFVDQRGTGESNGLDCPFEQIQVSPLTDQARLQRTEALAAACVANLAVDLKFYTTPYAVADLEQVRQSLGYTRINLWGVSYGTRVVLDYMRTYPRMTRTAVLDGAAPVSIQLPEYVDRDAGRALDRILEACAAQRACAEAYGDLRRDWLSLLDGLETEPRTVELTHPRSQERLRAHISAGTLSTWVQLALYSREFAPVLPRALHQAIEGDVSPLANIALLATEEIEKTISEGMQAAVLCAEDRHFPQQTSEEERRKRALDSDALLRLNRTGILDRICAALPVEPPPASYFAPVRSGVPTLVLSGSLDPVTPPVWGERVVQHLKNSRHLVVPNAHHGVTMQGCVPRLIRRFIETGDPSAINTACTKAIAPAAFFIDGAGPAMAEGGHHD